MTENPLRERLLRAIDRELSFLVDEFGFRRSDRIRDGLSWVEFEKPPLRLRVRLEDDRLPSATLHDLTLPFDPNIEGTTTPNYVFLHELVPGTPLDRLYANESRLAGGYLDARAAGEAGAFGRVVSYFEREGGADAETALVQIARIVRARPDVCDGTYRLPARPPPASSKGE
jgi:hypothetical protein